MRKIILAVILGLFSLSAAVGVSAMSFFGEDITELPESGWSISASPSGKANAEIDESGALRLKFNTTESSARANVQLSTGGFDAGNEQIILSFDMTVPQNGNIENTIRIVDSNPSNVYELLKLTKSSTEAAAVASFLGGDAAAELSEKTSVKMIINTEKEKAAIYLNNSQTPSFSGDLSSWKSETDIAELSFIFRTRSTARIAAEEEWVISNFRAESFSGSFSLTSAPYNGQTPVDITAYNNISLKFGTKMSDGAYESENYKLYKGDEEAGFSSEKTESGVNIIPDGGFAQNTDYRLVIEKLVDLYGNVCAENEEITFKTAIEGYAAPKIEAVAEKSEIIAGETTVITFNLTQGHAERTEIYLNDACITQFEGQSFEYSFSAENAGEYKIYAKAYDEYGGFGTSGEISVRVIGNMPPEITVSGISEGGVYEKGALPTAQISASDENGIKKIEVFVDKIKVFETENLYCEYPLENVASGTHTIDFVVYDIFGKTTQKSIEVTIEANLFIDGYSDDFSAYGGNNELPAGTQGGPQRGYLDVSQIDEEHGKSLIIGMETVNQEYVVGNSAYVGFPLGNKVNKVSAEFDIYINSAPGAGDNYRFALRGSGNNIELCYVQPTQFWCRSGKSLAMSEKMWYHVRFVFDAVKQSYNLYINGEELASGAALPADIGTLNFFRVFGPNYDEVTSFAAVDNVAVKTVCDTPAAVLTDNNVDYKTGTISFTVSGDVDYASLKTDCIYVEGESGIIAVKSLSVENGVITAVLASMLESNSRYALVLSENVCYSTGTPIGIKASTPFTTMQSNLDVVSGEYTVNSGMLEFCLKIKNTAGGKRYAYVVTERYSGGRIVETKLTRIETESQAAPQSFSIRSGLPKNGETVKTYVLGGLKTPSLMGKGCYRYSK